MESVSFLHFSLHHSPHFLSITLCLCMFFFVILIFKSPMGLLDHRTLRHFFCWLIIELEHWIATFLRIHQMSNTLAIKRMRTKCGYKCFWCGQYITHSMHSIRTNNTNLFISLTWPAASTIQNCWIGIQDSNDCICISMFEINVSLFHIIH